MKVQTYTPLEVKAALEIAEAYTSGKMSGFAFTDIEARQYYLRESVRLNPGLFVWFNPVLVQKVYSSIPRGERRRFLWHDVRKVLGKDTENYRQEIGDCVSFGMKNALEYCTLVEIANGEGRQKWRPIFPPYLYGTGRVYVGKGRLGNSDGSLGSWMAEAISKFGALFSDDDGVPQYRGAVAKAWGDPNPSQDLDKFKNIASPRLAKYVQIRNWEEFVVAICVGGKPCTIASNQGFQMEAGSDGFHRASGSWAHQMCFIGVDDEYDRPYAPCLNSWGDVHGRLKSFYDSNEQWPIGTLRVEKRTVENMINQNECFAIFDFEGDVNNLLERALFNWGVI